MEYYVYIILNTLKPGIYKYNDYTFDYEPFYVGKGKGKRKTNTLTEKKNSHKKGIIEKIKENGLKPIRIIIKDNLTEEESFELEIQLILLIGRKDIGNGTLVNFTNGGEGTSGVIQSDETKNKRKNSLLPYREYFKSDDFKNTMRKVTNDRKLEPEYELYRKKMSEKYSGNGNPMYGKSSTEKQKEAVRKAHRDGKIKISNQGLKNIIEASKKRIGTKNEKKRTDIKKYILMSPSNIEHIIFGNNELQKFCKDNKLQYHTIKNNSGYIDNTMIKGNRIHSKNTIGWKIN